ncbi:MAG TPA: CHAD domain-containing protein [Bryobacteraceae bacterium]
MAYRLKRGESVEEAIRRIARAQLGSAAQHLRAQTDATREEAVHEARKSLKKVRALLRLAGSGLGTTYEVEGARLREIGQKLSQIRDASALITAFDDLKSRHRKKLGRSSLGSIHRALVRDKKHVEAEIGIGELLGKLAGTLTEIRKGARHWTLEEDGFSAIEGGVEKIFRRGRKALDIARSGGSREQFHEWRKRVKDHWYHVRLLENLWSDVLKGYENSLEELEDALGEDLNLALLRERITSTPEGYGSPADIRLVTATIDQDRQELRKCALEIGARVYGEKPARFTREVRRLWRLWRSG